MRPFAKTAIGEAARDIPPYGLFNEIHRRCSDTQENKALFGIAQGYRMMNAIKTTERRLANGTFWHSDFGVRRSHGCVNVTPEDAKWIFRWTTPALSLDESEWRGAWPNVGGEFSTSVAVNETKL